MPHELSADEESVLREVLIEFNEWINARVREQRLRLYTMADLIAALYLRVRLHLEREEAVEFVERVVRTVERRIDADDLIVQLGDGTSTMPYRPAEVLNRDPGLRSMMAEWSDEVTDEDIEEFFRKESE